MGLWEVLEDPCTAELYYANPHTLESRWHLPRGLRYIDLHNKNRTAHLCKVIIPDDLSLELRTMNWEYLIRRGREAGNWTDYRVKREEFLEQMRTIMLTCPPFTRIYVRLAEPYRFEGEAVCDSPEDVDPDVDCEADGLEQLGFRIKSCPRYIWVLIPSADNAWLGTDWLPVPEYEEYRDAESYAREDAEVEGLVAARLEAIKEYKRNHRETEQQGGKRSHYKLLQVEQRQLRHEETSALGTIYLYHNILFSVQFLNLEYLILVIPTFSLIAAPQSRRNQHSCYYVFIPQYILDVYICTTIYLYHNIFVLVLWYFYTYISYIYIYIYKYIALRSACVNIPANIMYYIIYIYIYYVFVLYICTTICSMVLYICTF